MEVYRTHISRTQARYLVLTDPDPKTGALRGVIVDVLPQTVRRVKSIPALLKAERWQVPGKEDLTLDALVRAVPALRRHRGIEIRLPSGVTAWILWRQWSSADAETQALLTQTTQPLAVPAYEPDGDYFLAACAVESLGGEVLDLPRSFPSLGDDTY